MRLSYKGKIMKKSSSGFTLIELMIVVAIVGILAMIALPGYERHVIRSNRTAAQSQMMDIANRQQQYLLAERRYATLGGNCTGTCTSGTCGTLNFSLDNKVGDNYICAIEVWNGSSPPRYTITFTAKNRQTKDTWDGTASTLTLDSAGTKGPAVK
jgi:type IV pilus assembly protein PilE